MYSRTKGGMDAAAQFRACLNTQGLTVGQESKMVLYILTTLLVNGFIVRCIEQCAQSVNDAASLGSLDTCTDNLGKTLPFSDYAIDIREEFLIMPTSWME